MPWIVFDLRNSKYFRYFGDLYVIYPQIRQIIFERMRVVTTSGILHYLCGIEDQSQFLFWTWEMHRLNLAGEYFYLSDVNFDSFKD